jgi:hypothetical protein
MLVLGLLAAGAVVASLTLVARWMWVAWRRTETQVCVTEDEARENAAPLTTAVLSTSHAHKPGELANGPTPNDGDDS